MSQAFLNGEFLPLSEAKISPLDRGFLFGDGIYEVIPCYEKRFVGLDKHISRLQDGLGAIEIVSNKQASDWRELCETLVNNSEHNNVGIYIQISRGADVKRFHAFPDDVEPTVFAFTFEIPPSPNTKQGYKTLLTQDRRWQRCHIKSTSLLGNVLHFQASQDAGCQESILHNQQNELTEASSSNVFVVKGNTIMTPPLDNQILPGVTRAILLSVLNAYSSYEVKECAVSVDDMLSADEVWLTSSTKEITPVIQISDTKIGTGDIGNVFKTVNALYQTHKFDY